MSLPETETPASRVLYINSKDATTRYGDYTTNFEFQLQEPIVVPDHHTILMSLYSAEIPYSFYFFEVERNCRIDFQITAYNTPATYAALGLFDVAIATSKTIYLPEGNYTATQLASQLTQQIGDTAASPGVYPLTVQFDPINLKFDFVCNTVNTRVTIGLRNRIRTYVAGGPGDSPIRELGFLWSTPTEDRVGAGDLYVGLGAMGFNWESGYTNPPIVFGVPVAGGGIDTPTVGSPFNVATPLHAPNVCDLTTAIRSLFLRTNLSTTSILDSHIGGGFSNILCRIPINTNSGGIISVDPVNGDIHKLLIKLKSITSISLRLTNQENVDIDLNGLNFDVSLKLDFIHTKDLPQPTPLRQIWDTATKPLEEDKKEQTKKKKTKSKSKNK
jgi:hypothetical protein